MNPIEWLNIKVPGFNELPELDRQAIMHFSLLWSFFEAETLKTRASADAIFVMVHQWADQGRLNVETFEKSLDYFKARYFQDGKSTQYFQGLKLRKNDRPSLVKAVLKGENTSPADSVSVLLIVVYRLRNNLFHGVKWAYCIRGQLDNFTHANAVLMSALEVHGY